MRSRVSVVLFVFGIVFTLGCGGGSDSNACNTIGKLGKIAGGESCSEGQSNVTLVVAVSGNRMAQCTGAYISTTAVLTAAHCFMGRPQEALVASRGFSRSGVSYVTHPLYNGSAGSPFDIAIVKVDQPITAGPLPLMLSTVPSKGDDVVAYGYGTDQNGKEAIARIESGEAPLKATFSLYDGYDNGVVTIRSTGEGSPCPGDSGGPVVAQSAGGSYGIIGITVAGPDGCSAERGRGVALASTQSQGALSFITTHVPDVATN
jgi:V8-like Glu-specific endopeptidase